MLKKQLVLFFTLFLIACQAFSLNWSEAVTLAQKNNNELKSAQKSLESYEWNYRKAFTSLLPQLSASAGMTETLSATSSATSKSYSYGLSASQVIFQGMENIYAIQSAYANVEHQKANLQNTMAAVFYNIRSAYVELLYNQENRLLLDEILTQRKQNSRLINLRYESGREDKGNMMATQADEKSAEYDVAAAGRSFKLAQLNLSQLLESEIKEVTREALGSLKKVDFEKLLRESPAYIMAKKKLELAEISHKTSISGFLPSVSLSGSYSKRGSDWPPQTLSKSWSLNFSYAFFPGGSNFIEQIKTSVELEQAREDFAKTEKNLRYDLESAYENYSDALEALEVEKIKLAASEERARIIQSKYLNGLASYDEWYRLENSSIAAQKSLLNLKKKAFLAEALWYKTYGGRVQ